MSRNRTNAFDQLFVTGANLERHLSRGPRIGLGSDTPLNL
jgi:hypothetical protein